MNIVYLNYSPCPVITVRKRVLFMHDETIAVTSGRKPFINSGNVNPPIYKTSTVLFKTMKEYMEAASGRPVYENTKSVYSIDYSYATTGTPTTYALRTAIAELEGADDCLILPSGLSAITTTLLTFLSSGDHLLIVDNVYGPTRRFCNNVLSRLGIEVTFYDPLIGSNIKNLIQKNTKIIFCESPGSLTFEVQDIPAISAAAKKVNKDIIIVSDNSWSTPLYFKPFMHGVDISIHAGTKYICGHSDMLLGTVSSKKKHFETLFTSFRNFGNVASPDDCYNAARGLRSMPTRLKQHEKSALQIASYLASRKEVKSVLHPAFDSCPGHEIFKRDFKGSTGLFSIVLDKKYSLEAISNMTDNMKYFGIGCSWGGFESLILLINPGTTRSTTKWTTKNTVIRLHIGLENVEDLQNDLSAGLDRLNLR